MTLFQHLMATLPASIESRVEIMREVLTKVSLTPAERQVLRSAMAELDAHILAVREATLELDLGQPRGSGRLGDKPMQRGAPRLGDKVVAK